MGSKVANQEVEMDECVCSGGSLRPRLDSGYECRDQPE